MTKNGWFNTGDVGMLYPNGSVRIIDRAKNIFKLA
jgi:long-chain acyl-CoA synthetase